jgi:hypothetical protein
MNVTYCVVLAFVMADDGVAPSEAAECPSANTAGMRAETFSRKPGCAGAIAFSRPGHLATGDVGDAKLIRKFRRSARGFVLAVKNIGTPQGDHADARPVPAKETRDL